jgi:hypothetical protein
MIYCREKLFRRLIGVEVCLFYIMFTAQKSKIWRSYSYFADNLSPVGCYAMSSSRYFTEVGSFVMSSFSVTWDTKTLLKIWNFYYQYFNNLCLYTVLSLWIYAYIRKISASLAHNYPDVSCNFPQPPTEFRDKAISAQSHIYPSFRIIYPIFLTIYNIWNLNFVHE